MFIGSKLNIVASGIGVEPIFPGSEPDVLPVRRPRKRKLAVGGRRLADSPGRPKNSMVEIGLVKTAGLEPATFAFVARCSDSVELRLREKL